MVNVHIKKVVGYARVSSDSQIENTSIKEQVEKIKAYCISQGWELAQMFIDEGKSGSTTERDGYQAMTEYMRESANGVTGVVVMKADRIHRSLRNLLTLIQDEMEPYGIAFISVSEKFDTSTAQGMLFLQMVGSFAEFERSIINERTKGGRIATAKSNKYAGGAPAYGYRVVNGEIQTDNEKAEIVDRIFKEFTEGSTMYRIAKMLTREGITTKTGAEWKVPQVKNVLTNETYTGFSSYNGTKEKNNIKQKGVFPKIISRQLWNKAQKLIGNTEE